MCDEATSKQLRILTGVLKRAAKEQKMYKDEVKKLTGELEQMGPEHDRFRQSSQALGESKDMEVDAASRLVDAREQLLEFVESNNISSLKEWEDEQQGIFFDAKTWLKETEEAAAPDS